MNRKLPQSPGRYRVLQMGANIEELNGQRLTFIERAGFTDAEFALFAVDGVFVGTDGVWLKKDDLRHAIARARITNAKRVREIIEKANAS